MQCWIYRSPRHLEMYLYLSAAEAFELVPEALLTRFGTPELILSIDLQPSRVLARVATEQVLQALTETGFFLQLPPKLEPKMYYGE
jgi:uncharacterized protein YcgL (UPF0745 family)